jgi:hypothetical protein
MKKILFLWMLLLLGAVTSFAQTSGTIGSLVWTLDNGTLTISGKGAMPDYSNSNNAPWYHDRSIITVIIEDGVTSIGRRAFKECVMTSVTIGNSVTSIGEEAFSHCDGLATINIPNSVKDIGYRAFFFCNTLTTIHVEAGNNLFLSEDGVLFKIVDPHSQAKMLVCYPGGKTGHYTIPNNNVTSIGEEAFSYCYGLTSVIIGNSVTSIEEEAFYWCGFLTSITISNSVTDIGDWAFYNCRDLTSFTNLSPTPQGITVNVFGPPEPVFEFRTILSKVTLYVPAGSVETYQTADVWKDFGTITAYVPSAINAPPSESDIHVYPNPAKDLVEIKNATGQEKRLYNVAGKLLTSTHNDRIDMSGYPNGIYVLHSNNQVVKIVKKQ